ncbi:hypothetical protein APHAL10511_008677 [Amanita phalloides]|nr:hypothetical protein APHAL10511_008677 [Amanita phalloides]
MRPPTFFEFVHDQWSTVPPVVTADLTGKTVVVTGSNTGLGFEAAKHFAKMNPAKLILACRSKQRGETALAKLRAETGYDGAEVWLVDQADFSSVKAFADKFLKEEDRLDCLMLNAAIAIQGYTSTTDGWESVLQVNHLSTALLALLLLPRMIETARRHSVTPRLVIISSDTHHRTTFDQQVRDSEEPLKILGSKEYCTPEIMGRRYPETKLLNVFFVRALADRLANLPIIVNAVNPGYAHSELRRNVKSWALYIRFLLMDALLAIPTEKASRRLIWGATGGTEDEEILRGAYISSSHPGVKEPSDFVIGEQGQMMQEKLWKETLSILSKVDARITETATQVLPRD